VKEKIKAKQEILKDLDSSGTEEKQPNKMRHKIAKRDAKKAIMIAKNNAYEIPCQKLESKKEDKEVFKLARAREGKTRDMSSVSYFFKLFNDENWTCPT